MNYLTFLILMLGTISAIQAETSNQDPNSYVIDEMPPSTAASVNQSPVLQPIADQQYEGAMTIDEYRYLKSLAKFNFEYQEPWFAFGQRVPDALYLNHPFFTEMSGFVPHSQLKKVVNYFTQSNWFEITVDGDKRFFGIKIPEGKWLIFKFNYQETYKLWIDPQVRSDIRNLIVAFANSHGCGREFIGSYDCEPLHLYYPFKVYPSSYSKQVAIDTLKSLEGVNYDMIFYNFISMGATMVPFYTLAEQIKEKGVDLKDVDQYIALTQGVVDTLTLGTTTAVKPSMYLKLAAGTNAGLRLYKTAQEYNKTKKINKFELFMIAIDAAFSFNIHKKFMKDSLPSANATKLNSKQFQNIALNLNEKEAAKLGPFLKDAMKQIKSYSDKMDRNQIRKMRIAFARAEKKARLGTLTSVDLKDLEKAGIRVIETDYIIEGVRYNQFKKGDPITITEPLFGTDEVGIRNRFYRANDENRLKPLDLSDVVSTDYSAQFSPGHLDLGDRVISPTIIVPSLDPSKIKIRHTIESFEFGVSHEIQTLSEAVTVGTVSQQVASQIIKEIKTINHEEFFHGLDWTKHILEGCKVPHLDPITVAYLKKRGPTYMQDLTLNELYEQNFFARQIRSYFKGADSYLGFSLELLVQNHSKDRSMMYVWALEHRDTITKLISENWKFRSLMNNLGL